MWVVIGRRKCYHSNMLTTPYLNGNLINQFNTRYYLQLEAQFGNNPCQIQDNWVREKLNLFFEKQDKGSKSFNLLKKGKKIHPKRNFPDFGTMMKKLYDKLRIPIYPVHEKILVFPGFPGFTLSQILSLNV